MGHAALFTPPAIHRTNVVIFPQYLAKSRLKNFIKSIKAKYTMDKDGLVTVMNDAVEFHFKSYHKHIDLIEITADPSNLGDVQRCIEFLRYESYVLQKPIYCVPEDDVTLSFLRGQGFRIIAEEEEMEEIYSSFWESNRRKA